MSMDNQTTSNGMNTNNTKTSNGMTKNDIKHKSLKAHKYLRGKIEIISKTPLKSINDLSIYYTPGVGAVASYIALNKKEVNKMTIKRNTVAIVTDGSAVLGLGNIGPEGAIPVMEGKAMIFKEFANINAFPIVLATQDINEIIKTVQYIAPVFGGINLEDISAPRCFEIEKILQETLDIPVIHDDQHGAAIATLAGLYNALKLAKKSIYSSKIIIIGAGAAGTGITELLIAAGAKHIIVIDSKGIISQQRTDLNSHKQKIALMTNPDNINGGLTEAAHNADVLIGVSGPGLIKPQHIKSMNQKPIIFALANPVPEILPLEAKKAGAFIIATGRSDFENQINNSLVFPGLFRGALDHKVKKITTEMKLKIAKNLSRLVKRPTAHCIIPTVFDKNVVKAVAKAVK